MPVAIRLAPDGSITGPPRKSPSPRIFIEGGRPEGYAISPAGLRLLRDDPEQRAIFAACCDPKTGFRAFLDHWRFLDQENGVVRVLGASLWPAQEAYLAAVEEHSWTFMLKARQLGETTIAIAFDAYVARFRTPNARVHCFSSGDDAAKEVLDAILFGLQHLPPAFRLPMYSTTRSIRLDCGNGERAFIRSYPSTRAASRGSTCNHLHLDELSAMLDPRKVYQSVLPTVAPGGTFSILTTEVVGPESYTATYFRKCIEGEGKHHALFVPALARPDRDEAWLEGTKRSLPRSEFAREYPSTWQEALESSGESMFAAEDVAVCSTDFLGCFSSQAEYESRYANFFGPKPRRYYSCGVDVGLKNDATVFVMLDCTEEIADVVAFRRLKGTTSTEVGQALAEMHRAWPRAHFTFEVTGIGLPIFQSLSASGSVPESRLHEFHTSAASKARVVNELAYLIECQHLRFDPDATDPLQRELLSYRRDDHAIQTDCVLAICFSLAGAPHAHDSNAGRILSVSRF